MNDDDQPRGGHSDAVVQQLGNISRLLGRIATAVGSPAPVGAQYLTAVADATLTGERVATDTTSITWDFATAAQGKAKRAALTGDVTAAADSNTTTLGITTTRGDVITRGVATNGRLALGATNTVFGSDGTDAVWRTLTVILDAVIGSTRGMLIARGAAVWQSLTVGAANTVLKSDATDPGWGTVTALLDALFSSTQGAILYRDASSWAALAPGTANQVLKTGGSAANPAWGGGIATIASGSFPAATTLSITSIPAFYKYLIFQINGVSSDTATRHFRLQPSVNNGGAYDTTAANYVGQSNSVAPAAFAEASFCSGIADQAAAVTWTGTVYIFGYQGGPNAYFTSQTRSSVPSTNDNSGLYIGSTSAINALQVLWNGTGNFDAGTYALYGVL